MNGWAIFKVTEPGVRMGLVVAFQRQRAASLVSANGKDSGGDSTGMAQKTPRYFSNWKYLYTKWFVKPSKSGNKDTLFTPHAFN